MMFGLHKYVYAAAALACLGLAGWGFYLKADNARLAMENAALSRSVAALAQQAENSALARDVERVRADAEARRNAELQATIEAILTGDITDAPLDPDLAARLNSLRGTTD